MASFIPGDYHQALILSILSFILIFYYTILLAWFMQRRNLQPIQYRGPFLLLYVSLSLIVRVLLLAILSMQTFVSRNPYSSDSDGSICYVQILFHNGVYMGLSVGTIRLFLLIFSYKLQIEKLNVIENGAPIGMWMRNVAWTRNNRLFVIFLILCIFPQILENIKIDDVSCEAVTIAKKNSLYLKQANVTFPSEYANVCTFPDHCPSGSIDPDFYLYVLIAYIIIIISLALQLRNFRKDRYYINMEFRLTALWMIGWLITDQVIANASSQLDLYLNAPQQFNELVFIFLYSVISLAYPLRKSYVIHRRGAIDAMSMLGTSDKVSNLQTIGGKKDASDFQKSINNLSEFEDVVAPLPAIKDDSEKDSLQNKKSKRITVKVFNMLQSAQSQQDNRGDILRLKRLLKDKEGLALFKTHLQLEFSVENILCWIESRKLLDELDDQINTGATLEINKNEIVKKLKSFVDLFVRESGHNQVNIASKQRIECEGSMEQLELAVRDNLGNQIYESCMRKMQKCIRDISNEILALMATDSFPRFANSAAYERWNSQRKSEEV